MIVPQIKSDRARALLTGCAFVGIAACGSPNIRTALRSSITATTSAGRRWLVR